MFYITHLGNEQKMNSKVNDQPYVKDQRYLESKQYFESQRQHFNSLYETSDKSWTHDIPKKGSNTTQMFFHLRKRVQKLCQNQVSIKKSFRKM